ncbi:MAG: right-handed parallel beta-helix repeat-containing protein [Phycisphaerales bacterium]
MVIKARASFLASVLLCSVSAHAQTRLYVNANAAAGGNGLSWQTAMRSVQDALNATTQPPVTEVWVAAGRYVPSTTTRDESFVLRNNLALYGGFAGNETSLSERNPATNITTLSGDLLNNDNGGFSGRFDNSYHVIDASSANNSAILDGFVIDGGSAFSSISLEQSRGGGVYCGIGGAPSLRNNTFYLCEAKSGGGALWIEGGETLIENCSFLGNRTTGGSFGTVELIGGNHTLVSCLFADNQQISVAGNGANISLVDCGFSSAITKMYTRAIEARNAASLLIDHCSVEGFRHSSLSAVRTLSVNHCEIVDSMFLNNTNEQGRGGAVSVGGSEGSFIHNTVFIGNNADSGGALTTGDRAEITSCVFLYNKADSTSDGVAGAYYIYGGYPESTIVRDSLFLGNYGSRESCISGISVPLAIVNSAFIDNRSFYGSVVRAQIEQIDVFNCRFIRNHAAQTDGVALNCDNGRVANTLFTHNTSSVMGRGCAMFLWGVADVINCTVAFNQLQKRFGYIPDPQSNEFRGAGITVLNTNGPIPPTVRLCNTVLWGNRARNDDSIKDQLLVGDNTTFEMFDCIVQDWDMSHAGIRVTGDDPLLTNATTFRIAEPVVTTSTDPTLSSGSPAIDQGDNTWLPADIYDIDNDGDTSEPLPLDVHSQSRFVDDPLTPDPTGSVPPVVDIGSFEFQPGEFANQNARGVRLDPAQWAMHVLYNDLRADLNHDKRIDAVDGMILRAFLLKGSMQ